MSTPAGYPQITSSLFYDDAAKAIDWLCQTFGFHVREKVEGQDGEIVYSELGYESGVVMIQSAGKTNKPGGPPRVSPRHVDGQNTQTLSIYVADVEAHHAHAKAEGANIVFPLETSDYGPEWFVDRGYGCLDPEGHWWWFCQRLRDAPTKTRKPK